MDQKTETTMTANLLKNTGKTIEQWMEIAKAYKATKHSETVNYLKDNFGLGLFFADLIVHKANGTDAASFSEEELIQQQYKGKEALKPVYDKLIAFITALGSDIEVAPKKAYVSLRRKKQFACLKPATKTRFELELIIKGQPATEILEAITGAGAMCTHKINLHNTDDINAEVFNWITIAYNKAI